MKIAIDNIFKSNDRVFHISFGWGTVSDFILPCLIVDFDSSGTISLMKEDVKDLLSFTEYTLEGFSQERPEELPKKGQIVWVRGEFPSEWTIGHFIEKIEGYYFVSVYPNLKDWNYKGIEIRTTNPYENEN